MKKEKKVKGKKAIIFSILTMQHMFENLTCIFLLKDPARIQEKRSEQNELR